MPFDLKWITWTTGVLHRRNVGLFYFSVKTILFCISILEKKNKTTRIGIENSIWSLLGCGGMQEKFSKEFVIATCFVFFKGLHIVCTKVF